MAQPYSAIARCYDALNGEVDYAAWADYYAACFRRFSGRPVGTVAELGCGTGAVLTELGKLGYDLIGIDNSAEMLGEAFKTLRTAGFSDALLLEQDMRDFELYGTVDAFVCTLDGLNYLSGLSDLKRVCKLVANYLDPGGLFLFDLNTPYKFRNVFCGHDYIMESDDVFFGWQNVFHPSTGNCDFYLSVFTRQPDGTYLREDEVQREHAFSMRAVKTALEEADLDLLQVASDFSLSPITQETERWMFIARSRK